MTAFYILFHVVLIRLNGYHQVVDNLKYYVETNSSFSLQLRQTFIEGGHENITYNQLYEFWDYWITGHLNYSNRSIFFDQLYQFSNTSTGTEIIRSKRGNGWLSQWLQIMKIFSDSINSSWIIPYWLQWNRINITQYKIPENGYKTFNQLFIREIKSEYRLIESPQNAS
eukprot:407364_1